MKSRLAKIAVGSILVIAVFAWLFAIDRNPPLKYHPTDGMSMLAEYVEHFSLDGGDISKLTKEPRQSLKTPEVTVLYHGAELLKKRLLVVEFVQFVKGDPKILREIGSLVNHSGTKPRIEFRAVGIADDGIYFQYEDFDSGGGGFMTDSRTTLLKTMKMVREGTQSLPNNSEIRVNTSFYVVQFGPEIRIYTEESLPVSLNPAREVIKDLKSFRKMTHLGE